MLQAFGSMEKHLENGREDEMKSTTPDVTASTIEMVVMPLLVIGVNLN